ncbi:uncharacterized protein LOC129589612 [Paramacrobiotus metropolitanus]|uniref:uncharacterized protein LOC129589612 n=1 Tax=Paramacrobiotus metropolitanus TaxID=2943436 RepID=UPI002445E5A2|nr:uncharacterized protein LOC129589612 [Paramacrobiotus metropolitanus]
MPGDNLHLDPTSDDYQVLLRTIYGQCDGKTQALQMALAWLIKNRADRRGTSVFEVCREFPCWTGTDDNQIDESRRRSIENWLYWVYENPDPTEGALYLYDNTENRCSWPAVCIGGQLFRKEP